MATRRFPIKGFKEGLLIKLGEGPWKEVQANLLDQIDERADFFRGAKIALDVNERDIRATEMGSLRDKLSDRGVQLFAVISRSQSTDAVAESLGLSTHQTVLKDKDDAVRNALSDGEGAILIRKTIRSGTSIKYPGHVIVEGDVNSGAEIIAGGSIYVWGKLRGSAHAGIDGKEEEVICAIELNPTIMRIANIFKEDSKMKLSLKKIAKSPQKACIAEGKIKISNWDTDKPVK